MARGVLDVAVREIRLDGACVVAVVGELVAAGVAEHVGCALMPSSAATDYIAVAHTPSVRPVRCPRPCKARFA
jgi:DNA-binding transcriptional LysR family regulator